MNLKLFTLISFCVPALSAHSQFKIYPDNKVGIERKSSNSGASLSVGNGEMYSNYVTGIQCDINNSSTNFQTGIKGIAYPLTSTNSGRAFGVCGQAGNATDGYNYGVIGILMGNKSGASVFGTINNPTGMLLPGRYAGYFDGPTYFNNVMTAQAIYTPSDIRLKENIVSLSQTNTRQKSILANVLEMNVIEYNMKDIQTQNNSDTVSTKTNQLAISKDPVKLKRHFGLAAQEIQQIYPDLVYEGQDGYLAINYIELIPILIRSIQELKQEVDKLRNSNLTPQKSLSSTMTTDINSMTTRCNEYKLYQNSPNPFQEKTVIKFNLPKSTNSAYICIFNIQGNLIKQLAINPGQQSLTVNGYEFTPGLYLYSLIVNDKEIDTKKMIITK